VERRELGGAGVHVDGGAIDEGHCAQRRRPERGIELADGEAYDVPHILSHAPHDERACDERDKSAGEQAGGRDTCERDTNPGKVCDGKQERDENGCKRPSRSGPDLVVPGSAKARDRREHVGPHRHEG